MNPCIKIFYQNVRGINTKLSDIYIKSFDLEYDIVALTETWLQESVIDSEIFCDRYHIYRRDRAIRADGPKTGGGVLFAVRSSYNSEQIIHESFNDIEFISVKVMFSQKALY